MCSSDLVRSRLGLNASKSESTLETTDGIPFLLDQCTRVLTMNPYDFGCRAHRSFADDLKENEVLYAAE
mgnify:CR=1 FL=1